MITCQSKDDYNILKTLRAHGWDRELKIKKVKDFNFINQGVLMNILKKIFFVSFISLSS